MILLENLVRTFQLFGLTSVLTFLIIFGLVFFFSAQIFAWVTPPRPRILNIR